jgi:rod shape-determining protein MreC
MPIILTVLLLAAWWGVPSAIKGLVRKGFYECQAPAWTALSRIGEVQSFWVDKTHSKTDLAQSGRDLARLNAAYLLRLQQADAQDEELRHIENMLYMPAQPQWRYVVGRVVRRDLDTWWQQIVIRRGASDGIRKGDGVVYRDGVIGRVLEVHASTAVVELVSSASFRVAAHVEGDLRPVTYVGTPAPAFRNPGGLATNVPADIQAYKDKPVRLVTSRLGGAFPDGLTIGYMSDLEREPDGLFQRSKVQLNTSLVGVEEVAVIVPVDRSAAAAPQDN